MAHEVEDTGESRRELDIENGKAVRADDDEDDEDDDE